MSKTQRVLTIALWALTVISMMSLIAARTAVYARRNGAAKVQPISLAAATTTAAPPAFEVPDFSLTNQDNKTVTKADLKGQVWVAAFIFTKCAGSCPMMSTKMALLQKAIADPHVKLVSFTLDPERDTPAVLKEYAAKFEADSARWLFLTGPRPKIVEIALGLKLPTQFSDTNPLDIIHSDRFVLINQEGRVAGYFIGTNDEDMKRLATEATKLASAQ